MALDAGLIAWVLCAAFLHAAWNAVAKASRDPLLGMAFVSSSAGVLGAVALLFLPLPEPAARPYLAISVVLHFAYQVALVRAYSLGDLSQIYPVARGLAPLGVALLAALAAREVPAPRQALGLLLASGAITSLGWIGRERPRSGAALRAALLTAVLISTYTVVDGLGVRRSGVAASYIAWLLFLDAFPILALALPLRRKQLGSFVRSDGLRTAGGGVMAAVGYGVVLWAMSQGAMAAISALRETGVIFAAGIGALWLGEPFGRHRLAASAVLAAGLVLVQS